MRIPHLVAPRVDDFDLTGDGHAAAWQEVGFFPLHRVGVGAADYATQAKVVYSKTGLYCLVDCVDRVLTCTDLPDFGDLFTEDVVEAFFWPDKQVPLYLEYEISPLGKELPILVPNHKGSFCGWRPWHYEGKRLVRKATAVRGGDRKPGARVQGWSVEFFIPFDLLIGVCPHPKPGDSWRANLYRIDYDRKPPSQWAWSDGCRGNFHDLSTFGTLEFGGAVGS